MDHETRLQLRAGLIIGGVISAMIFALVLRIIWNGRSSSSGVYADKQAAQDNEFRLRYRETEVGPEH